MNRLLVVAWFLAVVVVDAYGSKEGTDLQHGIQVLGKIVRKFLNSQPEDLKISDGVHLVSTSSENDARAMSDDGTVLGAVENYLQSHDLRIKLSELMPGDGFGRAFKDAMSGVSQDQGSPRGRGGGGGGGGKGGGGGGGIILLGLMMGKMMAALGLGGVGLLAWKALMVSALALLLSTIIGVKKLVHHDHDEGGHHVIHAGHGHGHEYRRKRDAADMAYDAWKEYQTS